MTKKEYTKQVISSLLLERAKVLLMDAEARIRRDGLKKEAEKIRVICGRIEQLQNNHK